jgi:hypothetical protein
LRELRQAIRCLFRALRLDGIGGLSLFRCVLLLYPVVLYLVFLCFFFLGLWGRGSLFEALDGDLQAAFAQVQFGFLQVFSEGVLFGA